jgi:hypothetical protein
LTGNKGDDVAAGANRCSCQEIGSPDQATA